MEADQIAVVEFCTYHHAEESFVAALYDSGLIDLVIVNGKSYVPASQIENLEKYFRLYYELDINLEGIETITYLQKRIGALNEELLRIRNRLRFYEDVE